jgi:DNA topoisomerase VI subunit A
MARNAEQSAGDHVLSDGRSVLSINRTNIRMSTYGRKAGLLSRQSVRTITIVTTSFPEVTHSEAGAVARRLNKSRVQTLNRVIRFQQCTKADA